MSAQRGQDILIKIDITGSGEFVSLAGLRSSKIAFNSTTVNATHQGSEGRWRELLANTGLRSAEISGSGLFVDQDSDARLQSVFFDGEHPKLQICLPDFGIITGVFQITALEYAGQYDGEMLYDIALASAGALQFSPEKSS